LAYDLVRRVDQHKKGIFENAFTKCYNFDRLVYFEESLSRSAAAKREKQIKGWTYAKKVALIESVNPEWKDLAITWRQIFE
jgi:putative endonuclease